MTSMTAVVKAAAGPGAEIDQVDVPEPKGADVLIEVAASSICGTDVHIFDWNEWAQRHIKPPRVFGHEMSGRIVATGPDVQGLPPGTFVAAETHVVDHTCRQCRRGLYHLCENTRVLGVDRDGSFARYVLLPAENCWRNAPGLSPEVAALQEPFGNAVHAATAGALKDNAVAIYGIFGRRIWDTWERTSSYLSTGKVDVSPLITHRFPLDDFQEAMAQMKSGRSGKVVLLPNGG